jgi:hypothetical protein
MTSLSVQELASSVNFFLCFLQSENSCDIMISITVNVTLSIVLKSPLSLLHVFALKIHGHFS